jgi:hypothetical protein
MENVAFFVDGLAVFIGLAGFEVHGKFAEGADR